MSKSWKLFLACFWAVIAVTWTLGILFYFQTAYSVSKNYKSVSFKIERGMTLKRVSNKLKENQLIKSSLAFQVLAYLRNQQNKLLAGEFELSPSMPPLELLETITSGKTILHEVTIPEGLRIAEIAKLLDEKKIVTKESFLKSTRNKELIHSFEIPGSSLEGYLFPDTYRFSKNTSAKELVKKMTQTFSKKAIKPGYKERAKKLGFDFNQIVTLASIIEKETGQAKERKKISSVFHNRLKKNMRLQSDPTVIYAIPNFDGNIHKKDLSIKSPYNTYKVKGLPPGPIANPGHASILAALYPETTKHLYFVSRQDGSHQFSNNLKDHNRAVKKYQLRKTSVR
jgi:UPF0755 protein